MSDRNQARDGETNGMPKPRVRKRGRALLPAGLTMTAAIAAILVLAAPLASASGPLATFHAPYTGGKAVQVRNPTSQGCAASLVVNQAASFSLTTGKGIGVAAAKSGACALADSQATYDGIVGVRGLTFSPTTSGAHTITASWSVTWNASASMTAAAANAGAQSTVEISIWVDVTDLTVHKTSVGKAVFIVQKDLQTAAKYSGGAVNAVYGAHLSMTSLTAGHSYSIYAVLGFSVQAVVPAGSPAGAITTATVDLGSAGHGAYLTSVVVS